MTAQAQSTKRVTLTTAVKRHPLTWFFAGSISLDRLISLVAVFDPSLFMTVALVISYIPALTAWLVLRLSGTAEEVQAFGQRLRTWRVGLRWYLFALLIMPIIHLAALGIGALFFGGQFPFHGERIGLGVGILVVNLGEEIAWRGFALPRLLARFNALTAGLILGVLWAMVHFVIWTIGDPQPLPAMLLGTGYMIGLSVIMTWVFNHTRGSVPLMTVMHAATDTMFNMVSPLVETHIYRTAWTLELLLTALVALTLVLLSGVKGYTVLPALHRNTRVLYAIGRRAVWCAITLLLFGAAGASYQAIATALDRRTYPPPGQLVDVGGYKLHIYCLGTGTPTVVTENGLGGSSPDWGLVQPAVSQHTRICSYDRAGTGWSETESGARTSQQISAELHTLLRNTGLPGPYILVGHSAGGMHVQVYASQYPAEVAGLVLVDPTPAQAMIHFSSAQLRSLLPDAGQFQWLKIMQSFGLLRILPLSGAEVSAALPGPMRAQIRAHRLQSGAMATLAAEAAGLATSISETAAATPLPTDRPLLILWHGIPAEPVELDTQAKSAMAALVAQSHNGKLVVAEHSGHYIPFERPDMVVDAINQVVEAVRTGQPLSSK